MKSNFARWINILAAFLRAHTYKPDLDKIQGHLLSNLVLWKFATSAHIDLWSFTKIN